MKTVVILTTPERFAAVKRELDTAFIGGDKGPALREFIDDLHQAVTVPGRATVRIQPPCPAST